MIIGVDEAGRGPLAGPVVAAAVVLCPDAIEGLGDSKALSEKRRIALEAEIKAKCRWAVGVVDVDDIDRLNIFGATMLAMALAVEALVTDGRHPGLDPGTMEQNLLQHCDDGKSSPWTLKQVQGDDIEVLIDGNMTPQNRTDRWRWPARAIVGGDAIEPCISAASIIAKQHRDRMMVAACAAHPGYGFAQHKGYGTVQHLAALREWGPCPIHRRSFKPVAQLLLL